MYGNYGWSDYVRGDYGNYGSYGGDDGFDYEVLKTCDRCGNKDYMFRHEEACYNCRTREESSTT